MLKKKYIYLSMIDIRPMSSPTDTFFSDEFRNIPIYARIDYLLTSTCSISETIAITFYDRNSEEITPSYPMITVTPVNVDNEMIQINVTNLLLSTIQSIRLNPTITQTKPCLNGNKIYQIDFKNQSNTELVNFKFYFFTNQDLVLNNVYFKACVDSENRITTTLRPPALPHSVFLSNKTIMNVCGDRILTDTP